MQHRSILFEGMPSEPLESWTQEAVRSNCAKVINLVKALAVYKRLTNDYTQLQWRLLTIKHFRVWVGVSQ